MEVVIYPPEHFDFPSFKKENDKFRVGVTPSMIAPDKFTYKVQMIYEGRK